VLWFAGIFILFGFRLWPVMIGNWLLDAATAMVLYLLARYIFPQRSGLAVLSVLMFAFYTPEIWTSYMAISESIFTLLLMLHLLTLVYLLDRPSLRRAAWSGLWLGLASLARPVMLAFPAIILILMLLRYRQMWQTVKHLIMLGLVFVIVLSPWIVRNYLTFGAFVPGSTLLGYNLIKNNYYLTSDDYLRQLFPPERMKVEMERLLNARGDSLANYNPAARDRAYVREALARIGQRPDRYLVLSANRFLYLWFSHPEIADSIVFCRPARCIAGCSGAESSLGTSHAISSGIAFVGDHLIFHTVLFANTRSATLPGAGDAIGYVACCSGCS
jgi:4-amino-4-deoxy-L-arabinose transferase-like glycosyltransferase